MILNKSPLAAVSHPTLDLLFAVAGHLFRRDILVNKLVPCTYVWHSSAVEL